MGESDFRALLEHAPDGVFVADAQGNFIFVNQAGCRLLGMRAEEILGTTIFNLLSPSDVPRMQAARREMRERFNHVEEWLLRHKDCQFIPVEISANILQNGQWQFFVRDISHRKRQHQRAIESGLAFWSIVDLLPIALWIAGVDGTIVRANGAARRIWGDIQYVGRQDKDVPKGWWAETGQLIAADEWAMVRALRKGETSFGELVRIQTLDGSFKTVLNSAAPLTNVQGEIVGAVCVNEDITELYDTKQKLQHSEALFRTVFELVPHGLYVADRNGRIARGNAAGESIWQGLRHVGPEEFSEYRGWWVDTGEPLADEDWALARAVRKGETSQNELIRIQCFDGTFKTVLNWAAPIRGPREEIIGAVAVNQDVTALMRIQDGLRAAVGDREHILAVVAHDLRHPLHQVSLAASLLRAHAEGHSSECAAAADTIQAVARHMAGIVEDLLAISVISAGGTMLRLEAITGSDLLSRTLTQLATGIADAGLELDVSRDSVPTVINVDVPRITRVFANLIDNAIKFTERGGRIVIRVEPAPGAVMFSIANSGPAVPDEHRALLFRRFWQAGQDDSRGTGLGLSICRSIIEAHGGTIWTEAVPGMRLKVLFLLPQGNGHGIEPPQVRGGEMGL